MWGSLKRMLFWALVIAAFAVAIVTWLGDHQADFGTVSLPPGGTVTLPKGEVEVFFEERTASADPNRLAAPLVFQVVPAAGGAPLTDKDNPAQAGSAQTQRSEDVISHGSVATYDVPEEGDYIASGGSAASPGALEFGTDAFHAVLRTWHLWGGLLVAAFIVTLLPTPHTRRSPDAGWAAGDPYAQG
jgi:hypothetical protein